MVIRGSSMVYDETIIPLLLGICNDPPNCTMYDWIFTISLVWIETTYIMH